MSIDRLSQKRRKINRQQKRLIKKIKNWGNEKTSGYTKRAPGVGPVPQREGPRGKAPEAPGLSLSHNSPFDGELPVNNGGLGWYFQIWPDGSLLKINNRKNTEQKGGGVRSAVKGFSVGSRRRMMQKIAMLDQSRIPIFITLTYPKEFSVCPKDWKKNLDNFGKAFKRYNPEASYIWKLEPQKRGAPHYHLLVWGQEYSKDLIDWVTKTWYRVVSSEDHKHLLAGTRVEKLRNWRGVKSYTSKYLGKVQINAESGVNWDYVGRYWGVHNGDLLPYSDMFIFSMDHVEGQNLLRIMRAYKRSKYRQKANNLKNANFSGADKIRKNCLKMAKRRGFALQADTVIVDSGDTWFGYFRELRQARYYEDHRELSPVQKYKLYKYGELPEV